MEADEQRKSRGYGALQAHVFLGLVTAAGVWEGPGSQVYQKKLMG